MAALRGEGAMPDAVPVEPGFTESRSRRNDRGVPLRIGPAFVQDGEVFGPQFCDTIGIGFKVVDQSDRPNGELLRQLLCVDDPREIRGLDDAV